MSATQQAFITAEIVRWARKRLGESHDSVADKINVAPDKVASWETGSDRPTFRQAQHLAHVLSIPFGYLFLSSPPEIRIPLPDLRRIAGRIHQEPSVEFLDLLNSVLLKQQWYREYLEEEGRKPLGFVGRFDVSTSIDEIAFDIKKILGITKAFRQNSFNWEDFFRRLVRNSESVGVLVLCSGIVGSNTKRKLSVDEFRGFAISDDLAPLVFINARDAKTAQIFTLIHELAHVWIGESGISNPNFRKKSSQQSNVIERFCNKVAAEVLLPRDEFLGSWRDAQSIENNLKQLSVHFRVSTVAVLRQAYELDKITDKEYWQQYLREMEKWRTRETVLAEGGGGDFYATVRTRNSSALTETVVEAALEGRVLRRDAARLLGIKVPTLEKISDKLLGEK